MPKRQTNNLKWSAQLKKIREVIDPNSDRVNYDYVTVRNIKYNNIGVTVSDKYFSRQDGSEIEKKIEMRIDREIEENQTDYRVQIKDKVYNIERIYVRENERIMELSLSYAN